MATTVRSEKKSNPIINVFVQVLRVAVGALFIFSGVVKANDPMGLANKMKEFFEVFGHDFKDAGMQWGVDWMHSMAPHALSLSVTMIGFEIIAGVALLLGFMFRLFSILLLLLNIFFTFLTAYVYYWDVIKNSAKVRECGCFGDCIKITNSETFWKDVALLVASIILVIFWRKVKPLFSKYPNTAIFVLSIFFAFGVQWWALEHLPFHDCMPYKIGNNIPEKRLPPKGSVTDSFSIVMLYKKDGVVKEFTMDNYPWEDSTWEYVDRKDKQVRWGNAVPEIKDFKIGDLNTGDDYTDAVMSAPGYTFLLFVKDVDKARTDNMDILKALATEARAKKIPFYILSSDMKDRTVAWMNKWQLPVEAYSIDGVANKTAIRTDPGLFLIEQGTIRGKWSFRDYPKTVDAAAGKK